MHAIGADRFGMLSRFLPTTREITSAPASTAVGAPFRAHIVAESIPLGRLLATGLEADGLSVEVSHDLVSARTKFAKLQCDLLILDLDTPDVDAARLLHSFRVQQPEVRVLTLSAQDGVDHMVFVLDSGADDHLSKPFSLLELMARVRALRRRTSPSRPAIAEKAPGLVLLPDRFGVEKDGRLIELTPREFALLEYLVQNPGKTLSRSELTDKVWNMTAEGSTNIVDVYIKYLRDKLDDTHEVKLIRTVRGIGYSYHA